MQNVVEIFGIKRSFLKKLIHFLGNRNTRFGKWIRVTYWKRDHKYLWGIINWCYDFEHKIVHKSDE